jgi:hypothetical protein
VATDTDGARLNVNPSVPAALQGDQGGAKKPSEPESLKQMEAVLEAEAEAEAEAEDPDKAGRKDLARRFNNLGLEYLSAYEQTGKIDDLERAIRNAERATQVAPRDKWYVLKYERSEAKDGPRIYMGGTSGG